MSNRIQRRRTKGWRMPANSVYVGRGSVWGNPWRERAADGDREYGIVIPAITRDQAIELYRAYILDRTDLYERLASLRGKDLACWCALDEPCHADVLIELAALSPADLVKRSLECARAMP